jgi:hypothetical protein
MTGAIEAYIRLHSQSEVGKASAKNANPNV